jgi:hypothetical protein
MRKIQEQIDQFRRAVIACDAAQLRQILKIFKGTALSSDHLIIEWHDALLFACAFPCNTEIYTTCRKELDNFSVVVRKVCQLKPTLSEKLINSGIAGTVIQSSFSCTLLKSLHDRYDSAVKFHSFDPEGQSVNELLPLLLPQAEFNTIGVGMEEEEWVIRLSKSNYFNSFLKLWNRIEELSVRESLFDKMKIYVELDLKKFPSRSTIQIPTGEIYTHDRLIRKVEAREILNAPLQRSLTLTNSEKEEILLQSRSMLAQLNRETDPVTYSEADGLQLFDLGRGYTIALFSMIPEKRLVPDSYIGFMMYKNRIPVSYGGAWMYGKQALIGINVFEAFRGGESAMIFAQLMRTYRQRYGVASFSVEPYQFGKDNPEGIASGAYWFYYRFGFRSDDARLAKLAEQEHQKINSKHGYRSSEKTLIALTESTITWDIDAKKKSKKGITDAAAVWSKAVTAQIDKRFNGNRELAIKYVAEKMQLSIASNWRLHTEYGLLLLPLEKSMDNSTLYAEFKSLAQLKYGTAEEEYIAAFYQFMQNHT